MESPDVVDTSDVDEREVLDIDDFVIPASTLSADFVASPSEKVHPYLGSLSALTTRHNHISDDVENPSPRKRVKTAHDPGSATSIVDNASLLHDTHASIQATTGLPSQHSHDGMLIGGDYDRKLSTHSDWDLLFSSPSRPSAGHDSRSPPTSQSLFPPSFSRSLSMSTCHFSPFSSPYRRPVTPPQTSQLSPVSGIQKVGMASSSARLLQTPSQSPPPQFISPRPESPHFLASRLSSAPAVPPRVQSPPSAIPEDLQPPNRYSFRRREARQLNPYAYDKLLYKQQLKSHPDAIVKYCSPRCQSGSGLAEDGTQNEFALFQGNPDGDGDYVEVQSDGGRKRRRRAQSQDRHGERDQEPAVGQAEEGWLPEVLKPLSSSDEEESGTSKLARKVRREREKAEALVRAEARRAAAKVRQLEKEARVARKRRQKPFPVDGDAERVSGHPRLSPPLPPRAQSEPATAARSRSPSKSPFRPPAVSRASSHSPVPSSNPLRSLDSNVYMQQEDTCRFDDDAVPFPRDPSPIDPFATYSAPSNPSAPVTTSGTSVLPSNASGMGSESDSNPVYEMSSKDRKRLRVLKRMMPAAMIARQLGASKTTQRARVAPESSGSEAEEVRLIPGHAFVRVGKYKDVEVKGDPESSDSERSEVPDGGDGHQDIDPGTMDLFSDGELSVMVRRPGYASPRVKREDDVISISDGSNLGSFSEDSENGSSNDEQVHRSLFDRPARGPALEKSLIDYMLTRTRGPRRPKLKHPKSSRKPRGFRPPRMDIVTSGARRYGEHNQTRLPFVRVNTDSDVAAVKRHASDHRNRTAQPDGETVEGKKSKKKKRQPGANQGLVYNVHHNATRITSKYRGKFKNALVIEDDDNDFRQALDPGWRAEVERWNKPVSSARQLAANSKATAPTTPLPRLYRRPSLPQNELPLPMYFQREQGPLESIPRRIVVDMNIAPLPSGVKLRTSYIEKGLLFQLVSVISGKSDVTPPMSCHMRGLEIGPATSAAVFNASLGPLCDRLASALREYKLGDVDTMKEWESVTRSACQLLSWLAVHAEDQEFVALEVALGEYSDGLLLVLESLETTTFSLTAHWFVVELSARLVAGVKYRRGSTENEHLVQTAKQLVKHLLGVDVQPALTTFHTVEADMDVTSLSHRAVELWVCLIHLLAIIEVSAEATPGHPLWRLLSDLHPETSPTGLDASEDLWRTIFTLCVISRFSVHGLSTSACRLPAAWELVASALKKIILISNPEKDRLLPPRALKKRDEYVSCVVSRCFLLWSQWGWRLDGGAIMFKSLQEIFRSRNFANLLDERSAPMGYLEHGDLELLSKRDTHDSVFEIFLKMVVQAVHLLNANVNLDAKQRFTHTKKLLQMAVPVSPVPFSRSAPPSAHSLSMLVNRFSAMVIAVHLDPTSANVKFRVNQAKRCVSFKDADDHSRVACVYGMMNFAMIVRHHKVVGGLEEVLGWLGEMTDVLMDEYKEEEAGSVGKMRTIALIQLLIGSVRRVIETQSLDKGQIRAEYPDSALLDGPWVTRVFNPRTDLVTIQQTGVEIRMLVQSFLDARVKAMPEVQPPPPPVVHSVESQEEYDKMYLDLNDEELLAALGEEAEASNVAELKSKEDALCKVLDKSIIPAVYRLVCKHFSESEHAKNDTTSNRAADEWIDCWVGCANVLVQNNHKDWGLYMKLGQQSWEKIIDDSWRRRVGLRFNLTLLRLDPGAYNRMSDDFIAVLLIATLSCKTTIEHEFISVVLTLDGLQHPLLRTAPFEPTPGTRKYEVSVGDYELARGQLIEVLANTAARLRAKVDAESQAYVELVVMMLSTMRDIYQSVVDKEEYRTLCRRVVGVLQGHIELVSHPRIFDLVVWWRNVV